MGELSYRAGDPESGILPNGTIGGQLRTGRRGDMGHLRSPDRSLAGTAKTADGLAFSRWPAVAVLSAIPTAADVAAWLGTPGDLDGCVVYMDGPYEGTTGYLHELPRAEQVRIALDFDAHGATVCVSESVVVAELAARGWCGTDITGGRRGQRRTFARVATEALTMNRDPANIVATQVAMFG